MNKLIYIVLMFGILVSGVNAKQNDKVLNIYSSRHYNVDKEIIKDFEQKEGVKINVLNAKTAELLQKLKIEGDKTKVDLLLASDAIAGYEAKFMGILAPVESTFLKDVVPPELQDEDWEIIPFSKRVRAIIYHKGRVNVNELSTYEELATPKWHNRVIQRSAHSAYNEMLMSSIVERLGDKEAYNWAKGIVNNLVREPKGSDRDQFRAIAQGIGDVTFGNTYYVGHMITSKKYEDRELIKNLGIFFPNQETSGAHVNISIGAIIKYSEHKELANKFLEFLLSKQSQHKITNQNYEYPINKNVPLSPIVKGFGSFKEDTTSLEKIVKEHKSAVYILDEAGWK